MNVGSLVNLRLRHYPRQFIEVHSDYSPGCSTHRGAGAGAQRVLVSHDNGCGPVTGFGDADLGADLDGIRCTGRGR